MSAATPKTKFKSDFLNIISERGLLHQCSNLATLDEQLAKGSQSGYCGFDPTAKSLHIGNLVPVMLMYWFQQCGHKPFTLVGQATSMIGDPSFKDKSRPMLSVDDIAENVRNIQQCYAQFLNYTETAANNNAEMLNNADWIMKLNYMEFLRDFGPHFTVNRMLSFDSVKLRLEREQPLTFLEFNYMIIQGYDFYHLYREKGIVLQMGGSDQWGNMINGVDLIHKKLSKEAFVLTVPLLTTSSGQKMGKSEGNAVWINRDLYKPYDYWQYWRNIEDADVGRFLRIFTALPMDEIERLEKLEGAEINEAKKILAFEATKICHGAEDAKAAELTAQKTFEQGGVGDDLPTLLVSIERLAAAFTVFDAFLETGLVTSKGEMRRLIQGNGARVNDRVVGNADDLITAKDLIGDAASGGSYIKLSSGKKNHRLVRLNS